MGPNQRFWQLETRDEFEIVRALLERRFGELLRQISAVLDDVDPLDLVYPSNPGEYDSVVREFVVLMQSRDAESRDDLRDALDRSFSTCFDEPIESLAIAAISERLAEIGMGTLR